MLNCKLIVHFGNGTKLTFPLKLQYFLDFLILLSSFVSLGPSEGSGPGSRASPWSRGLPCVGGVAHRHPVRCKERGEGEVHSAAPPGQAGQPQERRLARQGPRAGEQQVLPLTVRWQATAGGQGHAQ